MINGEHIDERHLNTLAHYFTSQLEMATAYGLLDVSYNLHTSCLPVMGDHCS